MLSTGPDHREKVILKFVQCLPGVRESAHTKAINIVVYRPSLLVLNVLHCMIEIAQKSALIIIIAKRIAVRYT